MAHPRRRLLLTMRRDLLSDYIDKLSLLFSSAEAGPKDYKPCLARPRAATTQAALNQLVTNQTRNYRAINER
jgi:hypothetical protein